MEKIRFYSPEGNFFKPLHKEAIDYLCSKKNGPYANARFWIKAALLFSIAVFSYLWLLAAHETAGIIIAYCVLGFSLLLLALNMAHDASHYSILPHKRINSILYYAGFALHGINGYFWQKRHLAEHHPFPNVPDRDPDLLNVKWLRYSSAQPFKKYHNLQYLYAPLLYAMYTLYWIFIKDFSRAGTPVSRKTFYRMVVINVFHKFFYLGVFIAVPATAGKNNWHEYLFGFLVMHVVVSLFLVFTFTTSHYISGQPEVNVVNGVVENSWEAHQVASSVDFHVESKIALFIFGGFNCHVAHHLFPAVSHVHYPALTKIIYRHLNSAGIHARQITFLQGIGLHFKLLKEMSERN